MSLAVVYLTLAAVAFAFFVGVFVGAAYPTIVRSPVNTVDAGTVHVYQSPTPPTCDVTGCDERAVWYARDIDDNTVRLGCAAHPVYAATVATATTGTMLRG